MHMNMFFQIYIAFYMHNLTFHAYEHYFSKFTFLFICTIYRPIYMLVYLTRKDEKHIIFKNTATMLPSQAT